MRCGLTGETRGSEKLRVKKYSFPNYNSTTGKIIGGPYLGKDYICDGWFNEGASNVDPMVSSLYYAADRKYNIWVILEDLKNGFNVVLDRYVYSNMAHQVGKLKTKDEREKMFSWIHHRVIYIKVILIVLIMQQVLHGIKMTLMILQMQQVQVLKIILKQ